MPLETWQFTFNGLTFGAETNYELELIEGLNPPEIRSSSSDRMQAHGTFDYANFTGGRLLTFKGDAFPLDEVTSIQTLMDAWSAAFHPQANALPLQMLLPGHDEERIYCRPWGQPTYVVDPAFSYNYARWAVQLKASNPRIYSETLHSEDATTAVDAVATNAGNFSTPVVMTLLGPIDTPTITHEELEKSLSLDLFVSAGQFVVFDSEARTIKLNDIASVYSAVIDPPEWFELLPGDNTISLAGTSTTGATNLEVAWRDARI